MQSSIHTHINSGEGGGAGHNGVALRQVVASVASNLTALSIILLGFVGRAAAQTESETCGDVPQQFQSIAELLTRIQQLGVALGLLIAALMYVWAGILWMRGTPDSQQRARRIFMNTTIGLVLILIAGGLVSFIKTVLCGGG